MKLEDYGKYYIQGSDHYLIPKDEFVELFNETINWKEESIELKKQLEEIDYTVIPNSDIKPLIDKLQQENEELKLQLKGTTHCFDEEEHRKLKEVIDKAIKYVEDYTSAERIITYGQYKSELLNILKGSDNNVNTSN